MLVVSGLLPAGFAVATGAVVAAVQRGSSLTGPLLVTGLVFIGMQVAAPLLTAVSMNLGNQVSAHLNDRLVRACLDPPGVGHLEDPTLTEDLTVAREFDRGLTGPPMYYNVDFIAGGLLGPISGVSSAVVLAGFTWWAPLVLVLAWSATHWLLRESGVWKDRNTPEVRAAQRHADYAYRLAVDPQPAKELRLFGLAGWVVERFVARRRQLFELQYRATRLREKSVLASAAVVAVANAVVFAALGIGILSGSLSLDRAVVYIQTAMGVSLIAFGGLNWALDGAAAPVAAVLRLEGAMTEAGRLSAVPTAAEPRPGDLRASPERDIRLRDVSFAYPGGVQVFDGLNLTIPARSSLAIVGQNGAGKTTLAKLLCRLYDPDTGAVEVDGTDLRDVDVVAWRRRVTAVFQDFVRFELPLRDNVAPGGGVSDEDIHLALAAAGADRFGALDTPLAKGYVGGIDLSGGQWQRIALARALAAVKSRAGLVLMDEPTAQLDVRGEAEVFGRVLAATRTATVILISHRFSTVRMADQICVLENGRVIELGSHDELMAADGRYRTMFDLQAQRFGAETDDEGVAFDVF